MMKKKLARGVLAGLLCVLLSTEALAGWNYERTGPGEAVWVNSDSGERVTVPAGQAAPDGTAAPAGEQVTNGVETAAQPTDGGSQTTESSAGTDTSASTQNQSAAQETTAAAEASSENSSLVMSNGRQLDLTKPMVALTYDDGPDSAKGNRIMDILEQYNGRATFFLVGNRVAKNAAEVQRMVKDGMEVANHSYDHSYYNKLGAEAIRAEISKCNEAIAAVSGVTPTLCRLPGGNITATVRANVSMPMIYWSIDTLDWKTKSAQKTAEAVVGKVKDGDIVLMHEIWASTVEAQATIIPALVQQGFQLVTVSELVQYRGYQLTTGQQYSAFPKK